MEGFRAGTPEGTRDRLFSECRERRAVQSKITTLFKKRGYSEVVTPELEYYDLFTQTGNPLPQESLVKIIDRSGKILVMRPDCTTPIARVAATKLRHSVFPQRLYYNQTVFRSEDAHVGTESEIAQCGVELIGAPDLRGDLEAIAMAVDTLAVCGAENFYIELGHAGYFRELASGLEAGEDVVEEMGRCIEAKNVAALSGLLKPYEDSPEAAAIKALPFLFGDENTLKEAKQLSGKNPASRAVSYLSELYKALSQAGRGGNIRFDLGLVNRLDYYTGVVFRGYVQGAGSVVLSGGRYDRLLGCFGKDLPSTGFAVYIDALAACLPGQIMPATDTVIHYTEDVLSQALQLVDEMENGTAELSPFEKLEDSIALARAKGAKTLVVLDASSRREVSLC